SHIRRILSPRRNGSRFLIISRGRRRRRGYSPSLKRPAQPSARRPATTASVSPPRSRPARPAFPPARSIFRAAWAARRRISILRAPTAWRRPRLPARSSIRDSLAHEPVAVPVQSGGKSIMEKDWLATRAAYVFDDYFDVDYLIGP